MWECDPQVSCDGHYLTNKSHCPGSASFSQNFAHFPQVEFAIRVVELGEGLKICIVTDGSPLELLSVCGEGRVAGSYPIFKKDSRVAVQIDRNDIVLYVDDMTVSRNQLQYDRVACLQLTLHPGAALLFDMSLSSIATFVPVLRKRGLTFSNPDPYTYNLDVVSNTIDKHVDSASIIFNRLMSAKNHFYQLKITECGADSAIGIGLADKLHDPTKFPGWKKKSCGYHSDDGVLFRKGQHDNILPKCTAGDVMGCGVRFPDRDPTKIPPGNGEAAKGEKVTVYFKKNSEVVGEITMTVPDGGLFPTIGISDGDRVSVDFAAVSG